MTLGTVLDVEVAIAALAETLEAMAFVSLAPVEGEAPPPGGDAVVVRLAFGGPVSGELAIAAPRAFGRLIAGNVDAGSGHLACTDAQAADAIGEVANVTCGRMLLRALGGVKYSMGLPRTVPLSADEGWGAVTDGPGESLVVDAEGIPVGLCLVLGPQPNQGS